MGWWVRFCLGFMGLFVVDLRFVIGLGLFVGLVFWICVWCVSMLFVLEYCMVCWLVICFSCLGLVWCLVLGCWILLLVGWVCCLFFVCFDFLWLLCVVCDYLIGLVF